MLKKYANGNDFTGKCDKKVLYQISKYIDFTLPGIDAYAPKRSLHCRDDNLYFTRSAKVDVTDCCKIYHGYKYIKRLT